jgi:hypothetical protein
MCFRYPQGILDFTVFLLHFLYLPAKLSNEGLNFHLPLSLERRERLGSSACSGTALTELDDIKALTGQHDRAFLTVVHFLISLR